MRIKAKLGATVDNVDVTDQQMCMFIDEAIEWYTKYAGYTLEYMLFCTNNYIPGCGVKLDDYVNYECGPRWCVSDTTFDVVTSTSTTATFVGVANSLLSSVSATPTTLYLTYDPDDVWQFSPCDATHVTLAMSNNVAPSATFCGPVTGLFNITNGLVTIFPANYAALNANKCTPLSAYWGCDITQATHVNVTNVPPCTIGGTNALLFNNGKIVTFQLCNTAVNTNGPLQATFEFTTNYLPHPSVYQTYQLPQDGSSLQLKLTSQQCIPSSSTWSSVSAQFTHQATTSAWATTSCSVTSYQDPDLMSMRKIVDVVAVDRNGTFGGIGENYLYGMDYAIAQNLWGGTALTTNLATRGFDFVTYELLGQYIELAKRALSRDYEFRFNKDTQCLRLIPEPPRDTTGPECAGNCRNICFITTCYIERPIKHVIKERWVLNYAMALTMIAIGHSRTKITGVTLFGGGSINGSDMMSQGLELKEKLENELQNGFGEVLPPRFFIG